MLSHTPLLDVRPHGRNQDKPVRYCIASCINIWDEEHAASSLVGSGPPGQGTDSFILSDKKDREGPAVSRVHSTPIAIALLSCRLPARDYGLREGHLLCTVVHMILYCTLTHRCDWILDGVDRR